MSWRYRTNPAWKMWVQVSDDDGATWEDVAVAFNEEAAFTLAADAERGSRTRGTAIEDALAGVVRRWEVMR